MINFSRKTFVGVLLCCISLYARRESPVSVWNFNYLFFPTLKCPAAQLAACRRRLSMHLLPHNWLIVKSKHARNRQVRCPNHERSRVRISRLTVFTFCDVSMTLIHDSNALSSFSSIPWMRKDVAIAICVFIILFCMGFIMGLMYGMLAASVTR